MSDATEYELRTGDIVTINGTKYRYTDTTDIPLDGTWDGLTRGTLTAINEEPTP